MKRLELLPRVEILQSLGMIDEKGRIKETSCRIQGINGKSKEKQEAKSKNL